MAGSRQFSVLSDNEIVKCQGHVCVIMKIGNQFGSLGKCTKSSMRSLGSARVVWGLGYQLESLTRWWRPSFCGLWVQSDGRRSSGGKRETRYQLLTGLHRDLQQNHDTVDSVAGGKNEETYIDGLDANDIQTDIAPNRCGQSQSSEAWYWPSFHCEWSDISVTVHCSSLISGRRDVLSYRGPRFHFPWGMFSEVDVRFASSFHALCSCHVDPPELLHLADSNPMHGRNVALVAVINTPTTFYNVNYVEKKWVLNIITDELSINEMKSAVI